MMNSSGRLSGAHPRSRGEHAEERPGIVAGAWLIPAHAGSTSTDIKVETITRAHPRSRGEHAEERPGIVAGAWLIPAHAGSTPLRFGKRPANGAHPRSRGEHGCCVLQC